MIIAIRKEANGSIYIDKNLRPNINYTQPPYNFKLVEVPNGYDDFIGEDFSDDLTFNVQRYNSRKQQLKNNVRIEEIKVRLNELSQDFIQILVGANIEDLSERKKEFKCLHNELRTLLNKPPRNYLEVNNET